MNSREKLIEDIKGMIIEKTVIPASIASTDKQEDAVYDRLALDIVAMFEKAHAPTADEREALAAWLRQGAPFDSETWGQYQDQLDYVADTVDGFRRSEELECCASCAKAKALGFTPSRVPVKQEGDADANG